MMDRNRVLVIAAHPDDEVLGCGGTIASMANAGADVHVLIMGEGVTARHANRGDVDGSRLDRLREQARNASVVLGVKKLVHHDLPDNMFDSVPLLHVVKLIEERMEAIKPDEVFTHHAGDLNIDHQIVSRATLIATRSLPGCCVRRVYAYEVPSSTEWSFGHSAHPFNPNVFYRVTDTLCSKLKAMSCYAEEARDYPHPRSSEALTSIAHKWGSVAGCDAAEAFQLIRELRS